MTTKETRAELRALLSQESANLVTAGQLARMTDAKLNTVLFWMRKGDFPAPVVTISEWRDQGVRVFHVDDVIEWLDETCRVEYWQRLKLCVDVAREARARA